MRKYVAKTCLVITIISFSAFKSRNSRAINETSNRSLISRIYLIYTGGSLPQNNLNGYFQTPWLPNDDEDCLGSDRVCYIGVDDDNLNNVVDQSEFQNVFDQLDTDHDNNLDDEGEGPVLGGVLKKKAGF